jgi:hypothetical protein
MNVVLPTSPQISIKNKGVSKVRMSSNFSVYHTHQDAVLKCISAGSSIGDTSHTLHLKTITDLLKKVNVLSTGGIIDFISSKETHGTMPTRHPRLPASSTGHLIPCPFYP